MTRILILGDTHCGNIAGLTPPGSMDEKYYAIQKPFWEWFSGEIDKYKPFDLAIGTGDFTDGEGKKGTLDIAFSDVRKQAEAAEKILQYTEVDPSKMFLVRGSPFHSNGPGEYEDKIADDLHCSIKDVQRLDVEGWRIHVRHMVGRSDTPYGVATPLLKEMTRNLMEAMREEKDAADIVVRGHAHLGFSINIDGQLGIQAPSLELPISSANGRRYMAWRYGVGFGVLTVDRDYEPLYQLVPMPMRIVHEEGYQCVTS